MPFAVKCSTRSARAAAASECVTSTTDPEAKLMRKGNGQPAKLSYGGHALMENRSGLCVDLLITDATLAEHQAATPPAARGTIS